MTISNVFNNFKRTLKSYLRTKYYQFRHKKQLRATAAGARDGFHAPEWFACSSKKQKNEKVKNVYRTAFQARHQHSHDGHIHLASDTITDCSTESLFHEGEEQQEIVADSERKCLSKQLLPTSPLHQGCAPPRVCCKSPEDHQQNGSHSDSSCAPSDSDMKEDEFEHLKTHSRKMEPLQVLSRGQGQLKVATLSLESSIGSMVVVKSIFPTPEILERCVFNKKNHFSELALDTLKDEEVDPLYKQALSSLMNEVYVLSHLHHTMPPQQRQHIVQFLCKKRDEFGAPVAVYEYVEGKALSHLASLSRGLSLPILKSYLRQVALTLKSCHDRGVLHLDLKGDNVIVSSSGSVKLIGFGSAVFYGDEATYTFPHTVDDRVQSTFWTSPERLAGLDDVYQPSPAADVWSFGCLFTELVTGARPWSMSKWTSEEAVKGIAHTQTGPQLSVPLSDEASDFVGLCFTIDPCKRPSIDDLLLHPFLQPSCMH